MAERGSSSRPRGRTSRRGSVERPSDISRRLAYDMQFPQGWQHSIPSIGDTDSQLPEQADFGELQRLMTAPPMSFEQGMPFFDLNQQQPQQQQPQQQQQGDDEEEEEEEEIIRPTQKRKQKSKKETSSVWNDYLVRHEEFPDGTRKRWVKCKHCDMPWKEAKPADGTTRWRNHTLKCGKTTTTRTEQGSASGPEVSTFDEQKHRRALTRYIVGTESPISLGEHPSHVEYVRSFVPNYQPVSRTTTRRDIVAYYHERQAKLKEEFQKGTWCVALTSDIWSGKASDDYISVVAHFIDDDWFLHKKIIGFPRIDRHDSDSITERIITVLNDYTLQNRVFAITLDNASANNKTIQNIRANPNISGYRDELLHCRCACHILNLIVKQGLSLIQDHILTIRECVTFLNGSNTRVRNFYNFCKAYGVEPVNFNVDCETRWNSLYLLLGKLLDYKNIFTEWVHLKMGQDALHENDWEVVEIFYKFLNVFYTNTLSLSAIYTPTAHLPLHTLLEIAIHFENFNDEPRLAQIVLKMKEKYMQYWGDIPLLYCFGFILDPRFKMNAFRDILVGLGLKLGSDLIENTYNVARERFLAFFRTYVADWENDDTQQDDANLDPISPLKTNPTSISFLEDMAMTRRPSVRSSSSSSMSPNLALNTSSSSSSSQQYDHPELRRYFNSDWVSMRSNINILEWWSEHQKDLPILSKMARDVLSVPVSTVSSESAFSLSGRILDQRRMSLTSEMVGMLTQLKDWQLADARHQERYPQEALTNELLDHFNNFNFDDFHNTP